MTGRNLSIRLAVVDGGKAKADLRDIGASSEARWGQIPIIEIRG